MTTTPLRIILDYTPRSHILCGEDLKEKYADFRINVLRVVEWATWHTRMKVPGGKGWCIRKENLPDLEAQLQTAAIPYEKISYVPPTSTDAVTEPVEMSDQDKEAMKLWSMDATLEWRALRGEYPISLLPPIQRQNVQCVLAAERSAVPPLSTEDPWTGPIPNLETREILDVFERLAASEVYRADVPPPSDNLRPAVPIPWDDYW